VKIIADTNILVRAITEDDPVQSPLAQKLLSDASLVAVTPTALCELTWVLGRVYKIAKPEIASAFRTLVSGDNVETDRAAAEAGLALLEAGGDFADGVIAHQGEWLGGGTFVSFDRDAIELLKAQNKAALRP
jgi:predicted nucleic-acid-binding protein